MLNFSALPWLLREFARVRRSSRRFATMRATMVRIIKAMMAMNQMGTMKMVRVVVLCMPQAAAFTIASSLITIR